MKNVNVSDLSFGMFYKIRMVKTRENLKLLYQDPYTKPRPSVPGVLEFVAQLKPSKHTEASYFNDGRGNLFTIAKNQSLITYSYDNHYGRQSVLPEEYLGRVNTYFDFYLVDFLPEARGAMYAYMLCLKRHGLLIQKDVLKYILNLVNISKYAFGAD